VSVALGLANLRPGATRYLPAGMLAGAVAMNDFAVSAMLGEYRGARGSALTARLHALVAWAPMDGRFIAVGAVVGAFALAASVAQVLAIAVHLLGAGGVSVAIGRADSAGRGRSSISAHAVTDPLISGPASGRPVPILPNR
jgi:hypothetical protein